MQAGHRTILDDVDLDVDSGALCALVGPSGAGKTTLLRVIAGLTDPTTGHVNLGGRPATHLPPARRHIGYVFQEPRLFPALDVSDNVSFALRRARIGRRERRRRADDLLDRVGLAGRGDDPVHQLSGGEQQRVALARALCAQPDVLLLDEPFAALDPHRRDDLRDLVGLLHAATAITTVLVTHDLNDAAAIADTVAVLDHGRVAQHDRPTTLFEQPATPTIARLTGNPNAWAGHSTAGWFRAGGIALAMNDSDGAATITCRPEHLRVRTPHDPPSRDTPPGRSGAPDLLLVPGTVMSTRRTLAGTETVIDAAGGIVTVHSSFTTPVPAGSPVCVEIPTDRVWRFPNPSR